MLAEPDSSILVHPDVLALKSAAAESGFRNVYRCTSAREPRWCAKIKTGGRLQRIPGSASPLAHQAALHVVRWYQSRYGARWREAASRRKARLKPFRVWLDERCSGWRAEVWEFGRPVPVTGRRRRGYRAQPHDALTTSDLRGPRWTDRGRLLAFATAEEARAAVDAWAALWWGRHAYLAMWRY